MKKIKSAEELEQFRKEIREQRDPQKLVVSVCSGAGCLALGSNKIMAALKEEIETQGLGDKVDLTARLQQVEQPHPAARSDQPADQQHRPHPQVHRLAPKLRQHAGDRRGDDLRGADRCAQHRGRIDHGRGRTLAGQGIERSERQDPPAGLEQGDPAAGAHETVGRLDAGVP